MNKLLFYLERCYRMTAIPLRVVNIENGITLYARGTGAEGELLDKKLFSAMQKKALKTTKPFLEFENDVICFGAMRDATDSLVIAGPVLPRPVGEAILRKYAQSHNIRYENLSLVSKSMIEMSALMNLLYSVRTGETINELELFTVQSEPAQEVASAARLDEYAMKNADEDIVRMSYSDELNYFRNIREGIENEWPDSYHGAGSISAHEKNVGKMANAPLKHYEYMLCTGIALATRAAIEGGLEPAKSYAYSDLYLQRLEKCKTVEEMLALHVEMRNAYAKQVKLAKERRSRISYVEKAKSYIGAHLNRPYELDDIAKELGISKPYLSKKFNEEVGMGVMRYARKKRIETAANMLKYSKESISTIANYLCFQSQSHFGAAFKEFMGVTPQKYREYEQPIE